MQTGTKISGVAHAGLLLAAIFGGPVFRSDEAEALRFSEVSIITESEFSALVSQAPETLATIDPAELPPVPIDPDPVAVTGTVADPPDSPAVMAALPSPSSVSETLPLLPLDPSTDAARSDLSPTLEPMLPPRLDSPAGRRPDPPVVVDSSPELDLGEFFFDRPESDLPDTTAEETATTTRPVDPGPVAVAVPEPSPAPLPEPVPERETADGAVTTSPAPELAALSVPEPTRPEPPSLNRPRPRPAMPPPTEDIEAVIEAIFSEPALQQVLREPAEPDVTGRVSDMSEASPDDRRLTTDETEGLKFAVQKCWSVPVGIRDDDQLKVVLEVNLALDGTVVGPPVLIEPESAESGEIRQAFEAARRALLRCEPYQLPPEKYESWKQVVIEFDPKYMAYR